MSRKVLPRIAAGAAVVLLALIIPWPHETLEVPIRLGPASTVRIASPADATVASVAVREGQRIAAGDVLARLASRAVEGRPRELSARQSGYERQASLSRDSALAAESAAFDSRARATATALSASEAVRDALVVRSPVAGTVLTRRPLDMLGSSVAAGAPLFAIGDMRTMRVEIPVTERLLQSIRVGEPLAIHVQGFSFRTFRTKISAIASAAETLPPTSRANVESAPPGERPERFIAIAFVDNSDGALVSGMNADARLLGERRAYAVQWWNVFYHWTRRIFW